MTKYRIDKDSMGDVQVPAQAYYGAQTQRAVENFPISGWTLPEPLIRALGLVKLACATANRDLGKLTKTGKNRLSDQQVEKLLAACREVVEGKFDDQFPIDVFQTGSGTSSNMNANEVIANRAIELLGGDRFHKDKPVQPRSALASTRIPISVVAWRKLSPKKPAFPLLKRSITSKPTLSAMAWSSATGRSVRSPSRCSTSPTTSAGSAAARAAPFTKS